MPAAYGITITMSQETVAYLQRAGFVLYAFKAVRSPASGWPLVWSRTESFQLSTPISWSGEYQAYTSIDSRLAPGRRVTASFSDGIGSGQALVVMDHEGTGEVRPGPDPRAIAIQNHTTAQFACGISQEIGGAVPPLCAFALPGNAEVPIIPIEKVFLTFSTQSLDTGAVVEQSASQGALVDLTDRATRTVEYAVDRGWTPKPGVEVVAPGTDLVSLLIGSDERHGRGPAGGGGRRGAGVRRVESDGTAG